MRLQHVRAVIPAGRAQVSDTEAVAGDAAKQDQYHTQDGKLIRHLPAANEVEKD